MQGKRLIRLYAVITALAGALMVVLIGCGGGDDEPLVGPETGPSPSPSAQFTELLPAAQRSASVVGDQQCQQCHEDYHAPWRDTRHAQVGVTCEACHGGGSEHVAAPSKANILTYPNIAEPQVCGQCHGPTFEQWNASSHREIVNEVREEGEAVPNTYVKTCFRCHSSAFRIQMVDSKLAKGVSPADIHAQILALPEAEAREFAHVSLHTASCDTCHDPHRKTGNLTQQSGNEAQLRRATHNTDTNPIRPGSPVQEHTVYNHTCMSCHNGRGANPSDTALNSGTVRPNMHDSPQGNMLLGIGGVTGAGGTILHSGHSDAPDQCIKCHMPDKRHVMVVQLDTSCAPCHSVQDAAARHATLRREILNNLLATRTRMERWAQQRFGNPLFWAYTSVIQEEQEGATPPPQAQVPIQVKRARHNYFFVIRDRSLGIHNPLYTRQLLDVANQNLDQIGVSRATPTRSNLSEEQIMAIIKADLLAAKAADMKAHAAETAQ